MKLFDKRTGMEVMDDRDCLALVGEEVIGRIAVIAGGRPEVFPVNYAVAGDSVVFRTATGTKLDAAVNGPVAFEVDRFDPATRSGWSVVIHGRAEVVDGLSHPDLRQTLEALPVDPWAAGNKEHLIRIVPASITGRRVG